MFFKNHLLLTAAFCYCNPHRVTQSRYAIERASRLPAEQLLSNPSIGSAPFSVHIIINKLRYNWAIYVMFGLFLLLVSVRTRILISFTKKLHSVAKLYFKCMTGSYFAMLFITPPHCPHAAVM